MTDKEKIEQLKTTLKVAREWIGILRGSTGCVVLDDYDARNPSDIESEVRAAIDAGLKL